MSKINVVFFIIFITYQFPICASKAFLPEKFTASFEKISISALDGKEKKSKGSIDYRYPGNLRLESNAPDRVVFVSNPKKTWYYTPPFIKGEPGELTIRPTGKIVISRFFDSLKKGLVSNKIYKVVKLSGKYQLNFSKDISKKIGVTKAWLMFEKKMDKKFLGLKEVEILKSNGRKEKYILSNVKSNPKFSKDKFQFTPPANTRISQ